MAEAFFPVDSLAPAFLAGAAFVAGAFVFSAGFLAEAVVFFSTFFSAGFLVSAFLAGAAFFAEAFAFSAGFLAEAVTFFSAFFSAFFSTGCLVTAFLAGASFLAAGFFASADFLTAGFFAAGFLVVAISTSRLKLHGIITHYVTTPTATCTITGQRKNIEPRTPLSGSSSFHAAWLLRPVCKIVLKCIGSRLTSSFRHTDAIQVTVTIHAIVRIWSQAENIPGG